MTRVLTLIIALALVLAAGLSGAGLEIKVDQSVLSNGLTLLICPDTTVLTASIQTFVNAGSRDEDRPGITGLAHVFEHMMFRGTAKIPSYSDVAAPLGAETNAYTNADYTCYFINAEGKFLDRMLEIEADRIRNLIFTNETFRTELGPVKEERRAGVVDDPGGFVEVELDRLAYTVHTYQHPVIGWEEDLETKMTFEDGKQYKEHFYVPNNCVLVIAGHVDVAKTKELVDKYYGDWQRAEPYTPLVLPEPRQAEERVKNFVWKDDEVTPILRIAFHVPSIRDDFESVAAMLMINEILFSNSGRLTRLLKNQMSLVEGVWGYSEWRKDPSLESISARIKRGVPLEQVRDSIYSQLDLLRTKLVTPEELERARNNIRAQMVYELDRPAHIAGSVGYFHLIAGDYKANSRLYDLYANITAEKLRTVATDTFDKLNRTVVTLVPKSGI
jgi:predicted Zn-dependent peptidase